MAIVALVLSLLALVGALSFYGMALGWICAGVSIIFAVGAMRSKERPRMAAVSLLICLATMGVSFAWFRHCG